MLTSSRRGIAKISLGLLDIECTQWLLNSKSTTLCHHCRQTVRQSSIWHVRRPSSSVALVQAHGTGLKSRTMRSLYQRSGASGREKKQNVLYRPGERLVNHIHASELETRKVSCPSIQNTVPNNRHAEIQCGGVDRGEVAEGGECPQLIVRKQTIRHLRREGSESHLPEEIGVMKNTDKDASSGKRESTNPSRHLSRVLMDKSRSLEDAWVLYQHYHDQEVNTLSERVLETLVHRIIHVQRPTRLYFFRLLSVISRLRQQRQKIAKYPLVRTIEWNALIHFAGNGLRVTTLESYNAALDVYDDMLRHLKSYEPRLDPSRLKLAEPDIYTYTTLLNIAVKSKHKPAIEHATTLLKSNQTQPTRVTYLSTLPYRFREEGLLGIRSLLSTLHNEGHGVGIDAINAYITCAGKEGRVDIVKNLYMVLRQNKKWSERYGEIDGGGNDGYGLTTDLPLPSIDATQPVRGDQDNAHFTEGVLIPRVVVPDEITYTFVIQALAYSGDVLDAINVFMDMLSTKRPGYDNGYYQPSYPIFRAFFLAFSKHATKMNRIPSGAKYRQARRSGWNWERLQILLNAFFELDDCKPSARVVYWIIMSVKWTTGNDEELIRSIWLKLKGQFSFRIGGRLKKIDEWYGVTEERWKRRWTGPQQRPP